MQRYTKTTVISNCACNSCIKIADIDILQKNNRDLLHYWVANHIVKQTEQYCNSYIRFCGSMYCEAKCTC